MPAESNDCKIYSSVVARNLSGHASPAITKGGDNRRDSKRESETNVSEKASCIVPTRCIRVNATKLESPQVNPIKFAVYSGSAPSHRASVPFLKLIDTPIQPSVSTSSE